LIELEIRNYQDQTYNLSLQLLPIDEQIKNLKLEQRNIQDQMYILQLEINFETERLNELYDSAASRLETLKARHAEVAAQIERAREAQRELNALIASQPSGGGGGGGGENSNQQTSSPSSSPSSLTPNQSKHFIPGYSAANIPSGEARIAAELRAQNKKVQTRGITLRQFGGMIDNFAYGGRVNYRGSRELPPGMALGGSVVPGMGNTDRVPVMLMPGEFVVNKAATQKNLPLLNALNSTKFPSLLKNSGGPVLIDIMVPTRYRTNIDISSNPSTVVNSPTSNNMYQITFNMPNMTGSPNAVANAVIGKIREIEDRSVRSVRL
jgi:hypothetical protein